MKRGLETGQRHNSKLMAVSVHLEASGALTIWCPGSVLGLGFHPLVSCVHLFSSSALATTFSFPGSQDNS